MLADFLTKPLQGALFRKFRAVLLGHSHIRTLTSSIPHRPEERVEKSVSAHTCQTVRWADVVAISSKTPGNRHEMEGQQPSILVK